MIRAISHRHNRNSEESGFTLIELLVVIIILGVLSAVVVFGIRGTGDKGASSAMVTDARTLRTAEEAFRAQNGTYATEAQLAGGNFLSSESSLHDVVVYPTGGPGDGPRFVITCDPNKAECGRDGTTPDGNFNGPSNTSVMGHWSRTGDPPQTFAPSESVLMPNGKVLAIGLGAGSPQALYYGAVYDPASRSWTASNPPAPNNSAFLVENVQADMVVLEGNGPAECGSICGRVLIRLFVFGGNGTTHAGVSWKLFDPVAFDSGADPWHTIPDAPYIQANNGATSGSVVQLKCSRAANPASDCGKAMSVGGGDSAFIERGVQDPLIDQRTSLFDPTKDPSTTAVWSQTANTANRYRTNYRTVALGDGRVLNFGAFLQPAPVPNPNTNPGPNSEIYDPVAHTWSPTANQPRWCTRTLVSTGSKTPIAAFSDGVVSPLLGGMRILVAGGSGTTQCPASTATLQFDTPITQAQSQQRARVFDVATSTWEPVLHDLCACDFKRARLTSSAYGGKVVVVRGNASSNAAGPIRPATVFDASLMAWSDPTAQMPGSLPFFGAHSALDSGQVLVSGGFPVTAYIYTPSVPTGP